MTESEEIAQHIEENLALSEENTRQMQANTNTVSRYLITIRSARWRLFRNARLLNRGRKLLNENKHLWIANQILLADNAVAQAVLRRPANGQG